MIHFHPFLSSQSILQLARILSLILLAKFSCAVYVKLTGLVAEAPSATGYEPNDFSKENDSAVAPTLFSRRLSLCCVDNSCEDDAIILVESEINDAQIMELLASPLFSQETEASADQPEIYHSGREKFWTTLIIVPIKHLGIQ